MFRHRFLVTVFLVLSVLAASCAPAPTAAPEATAVPEEPEPEAEEVSFLIWDQFTSPEWEAVIVEVIDRFQAEHPNIEITREAATREQQLQTAKTAIASGTGPDLIYMDTGPGNAGILIDAGLLMPLEDFADEYGWKDRFYPWAQRLGSRDGKLYGLSLEMEFLGWYVNSTLFEEEGLEVPSTDEEILTYCAEAKEKGYIPIMFNNSGGWQSFHQFGMLSNNALGADGMEKLLFENDGSWTDQRLVDAVEFFYITMADAGCFTDDINAIEYNDANSLFYTGQALVNPTGTWLIDNISENTPDYEIDLVPFPSIKGGERLLPGGLGSGWFMSSKTAYPQEVAMFLDFIYSDESVKLWVEGVSVVPPLPFDPTGWKVSPLLEFAIATARAGGTGEAGAALGHYIDTNAPDSFNVMMQDGFQAVVAGLKTPEEQLTDLQAEWDAE